MPDPITLTTVAKAGITATKAFRVIREQYDNYLARRYNDWWEKIIQQYQIHAHSESEQDVEQRLHNLGERDSSLRVLSQSTKYLLESIDDSVLPPLAMLTAEYLATDKNPDRFFRGMCRSLSDMDFTDLQGLRTLLSSIFTGSKELGEEVGEITRVKVLRDEQTEKVKATFIFERLQRTHELTLSDITPFDNITSIITRHGLASIPNIFGGYTVFEMLWLDFQRMGTIIL